MPQDIVLTIVGVTLLCYINRRGLSVPAARIDDFEAGVGCAGDYWGLCQIHIGFAPGEKNGALFLRFAFCL